MSRFNQLKVRTQFVTIAVFIFPFLVGLGSAGAWGVVQINGIVQTAQGQQIPSLYNLSQLVSSIQEGRLSLRQALIETEPAKISQAIQKAQNDRQKARYFWEEYQKLPNEGTEHSLWPEFEAAWQGWQGEIAEVAKLAQLNTPEAIQQGLAVLARGNGSKLAETTAKLVAINYQSTVKLAQSSQASFELVLVVILASAIGVVVMIGLAGLVLASSIIGLTDKLSATNQKLSAAFSSLEYKRKFGEEVSFRLKSMTIELNANAAQQASGSQQQARAIQEVTSSIAELAQTAASIASSAGEIDSLTQNVCLSTQAVSLTRQSATLVGQEGSLAMAKTIEANHKAQSFYQGLVGLLFKLEEHSGQIREISTLIRELGEQTHLLALNAAIEAAGAGQYGERFGVVAGEVKNLADRSVTASQAVNTTLGRLQEQILRATATVAEGQQEMGEAVKVAEEAGTVITRLIEAISSSAKEASQIEKLVLVMRELSQGITLATSQQSSASSQMVETLQEIGVVSRQSASGSLEVSTTVGELEGLSFELNQALAA